MTPNSRPRVAVVTTSTRPGRVGPLIAQWFGERVVSHGKFDLEHVDLKAVALPAYDEPRHPRTREYAHEHTKRWSATIAAADAFVFVTPEYNHSAPPALVNALDYLFVEWSYKPAAFVSYGGISAGTRSVSMTKQMLVALKIVPLVETVAIAQTHSFIVDGAFAADPHHQDAAAAVLDELGRWSNVLSPLRTA